MGQAKLLLVGVKSIAPRAEPADDDEFTGQLPNIRHHKLHENMAADTDLNEFGRRRVTLAVEQSLAGPMGKVGAETANRTVPLLVAGRGCARRYERFTDLESKEPKNY